MPAYDLTYRDRASEWIRRTRPRQRDCYACREWNYKWFVNDLEEPYTTPDDKPFSWQGRTRVVGGRTNVWGRQSYRFSDQDLHGKSFDGYGEDWPISYKDLVPYYELVEDYVGISGQAENVPELPDSRFHPAMPMSCAETQLRTRVKSKLGWTVTIGRAANITRPLNGRAACHYCGPCEHGCVTQSYFNAAFTTVADALKSGNTTLITDAMVYRVLTDPSTHKATGVMYIDRVTREVREVRARAVLLCAQALESARILFNSAEGGLANSSGVLGHYLMDHTWVAGGARGEFPDAPAPKPSLGAPRRPNGLYTIRMKNTINGPREKKYLRGFGFQGGGSTTFRMNAPGYGAAFKKGVLDPLTTVNLVGFGEVLPRFDNFVALDPKVVDKFGIPVLRITMTWGENEKAMIPDMAVTRDADARGRRRQEHRAVHGARSHPRLRHPRDGHRAHGPRSQDVGAERVPADARHREPLRDGRLVVRVGRLPESDVDDHGARRARLRSPDGRDEARQHLGENPTHGRDARD